MHLKAQMSNRAGWHLFVVLMNETRWPSHDWPDGCPIPTPAERGRVLADLGYEIEPGTEWSWIEGDPAEDWDAPVLLMASVSVRPIEAGGQR
ncbi:hypothetical protein HYE82_29695 [Streptomyces sp. BR123]|uniref:DUF6303 family protein n=1 Tax=Streptomyces sp. BR123 TaxID=2749828 RepID=UPI0015C4B1B8|nr:DUF6303 family protein [Streptomyces sp. BR123]NXY98476.1 hypothetical protein [Streptomyces sp. BR123]